MLFLDAAPVAHSPDVFKGGLFSPFLGCRSFLLCLPGDSLQVSECVMVCRAVTLAGQLGNPCVTCSGDDLAALYSLQGLTTFKWIFSGFEVSKARVQLVVEGLSGCSPHVGAISSQPSKKSSVSDCIGISVAHTQRLKELCGLAARGIMGGLS